MRPEPSDYPSVQLVEALSDMGAAVIVAPSSDDRVDALNQLTQPQRHLPFRQGSDLILETVQRLLRRNGVQILSVQPGFDPVVGQLKPVPALLDLKPQKLEAFRDMHNPGLLPVERHAKLVEDLCCTDQSLVSLGPCSTGHYPVVRPPRKQVSSLPHLPVKGSEQDIA